MERYVIEARYKYSAPILISHQIWGRDPPSLCLLSERAISISCDVKQGRDYSLALVVSDGLDEVKRKYIERIMAGLLREVSPTPLRAAVRISAEGGLPTISYVATAIDAMLRALQKFYDEELDESDYSDTLSGALMRARLNVNQAKCLAKSVLNGEPLIYSETYGAVSLEEILGRVEARLVQETLFSRAWAEPDFPSYYLDLLSKLSSMVLSDLAQALREEARPSSLYKIFNSVWYIYGAPLNELITSNGDFLVTVSLPEWLAVLELERR